MDAPDPVYWRKCRKCNVVKHVSLFDRRALRCRWCVDESRKEQGQALGKRSKPKVPAKRRHRQDKPPMPYDVVMPEILKLIDAGLSTCQIYPMYTDMFRSARHLRSVLNARNIRPLVSTASYKALPDHEIDEVRILVNEGYEYQQIAEIVGRSKGSVAGMVWRYGLRGMMTRPKFYTPAPGRK